MTAQDFRRIALGLAGTIEGAHMGHPDFRVKDRIFATLHRDLASGMGKLTPDQQREVVQQAPAAFNPEAGAWGLQGCTAVRLDAVDEEALGEAMTLAWQNAVSMATRRPAGRRRARARPSSRRRQ
jgi:hypothetical protein